MSEKSKKHSKLVIFVLVIIVAMLTYFWWGKSHNKSNSSTQPSKTNNSGFNTRQFSINDPSSLWVIVNKRRPLPSSYIPEHLRQPAIPVRGGSGNNDEKLLRDEAATAAEQMAAGAKKDGIDIMLVSGYRSYNLQAIVYDSFSKAQGKNEADKTSARPGYSEHQTGLAADFDGADGKCQVEVCFENTPTGKWLVRHAPEYGFMLRYKNGAQPVVGYSYEPWHFRYVGKALAQEVQKSGKTLEEFFNLPAAPDYN